MSEKNTPTLNTQSAPSPMELVQEFHCTYSMLIRSFDDPMLSYERLGMRMSLIAEEFAKPMGAVYGKRARAIIETATAEVAMADDGERDAIEAADALADLIYVIHGMAIESGMDLDSVLAEVQASNLSKPMPDGSVKLREDGKVLKGSNFFPLNVARGLGLETEENANDADQGPQHAHSRPPGDIIDAIHPQGGKTWYVS